MGVTGLKGKLDVMCPVAKLAQLGTKIDGLIALANELRRLELYRCLNAAGLAIGSGSKKKVLIANTVNFIHNGLFKSKTTAEVAFTATAMDIAVSATLVKEACYLISLQSDGTPVMTMGAISAGAGTALIPDAPSGEIPIGYVRIAVAAGATPFDASSDDLDAGHITDTYVDLPFRMSALATDISVLP